MSEKTTRYFVRLLASSVLLMVHSVRGTAAAPDEPIITQHPATGGAPAYTAEVGRSAIRDVETGEPHGYMFYTAYRAPSEHEPRPITFIWNGGPGADSSLLHFSLVGPKLADGSRLIDNPDTWLAKSDLVLVDPIGTGFSRPAKAEYGREFYGTLGDVASVTEFIRSWRLLHDVENARLFLVGESWGAGRAASVGYALEKRGIKVSGLVLISGGWGLTRQYGSPALRSALPVIDMATTALYYGKTSSALGKDPETVRAKVEAWVRSTYAPALKRMEQLSQSERSALLAQLSRYTGLAPSRIDSHRLVISPHQFRVGLLADRGKELYVFDMRATAPAEGRDAPAILHYFRDTLGYHSDLVHIGLEDLREGFAPSGTYPQSVNEQWNYATAPLSPEEIKAAIEAAQKEGNGPPRLGPPLPATEEALQIDPDIKILVAAGMYDSFLPCAVGSELARDIPPALRHAITFKCYRGGHAMYRDAAVRTELTHDVESLIANSLGSSR